MSTVNLVFRPEMQGMVEWYRGSDWYGGEVLTPIQEFRDGRPGGEKVVVLGRHGNYHQLDLEHIDLLRAKGVVGRPEDCTLVVFDWHEDLDVDPAEMEVNSGNWAYVGLQSEAYANLYVLGTNPRGRNEVNPYQYEEEIRPPSGGLLPLLDRVHVFPAAPSFSFLMHSSEAEGCLSANESVARYFVCADAGFVAVEFRDITAVRYRRRRPRAVVSIDLDVLRHSAVKAVCPQGVMAPEELIAHLRALRRSGSLDAVLVCGLTEAEEEQDEVSRNTVGALLRECGSLLSGG
jgi:hypothetical protein